MTARIYDDFKVDFYKADGTVLCRDYRGSRKICAGLSDELKALKEAEGHNVEEQRTEAVEVVKQPFTDLVIRPALWTSAAMNM